MGGKKETTHTQPSSLKCLSNLTKAQGLNIEQIIILKIYPKDFFVSMSKAVKAERKVTNDTEEHATLTIHTCNRFTE